MTGTGDCLVCQDLAASEAALLERIAVLEAEVAAYRDLAHVGASEVARLTAQLESARYTIQVLRAAERPVAPEPRVA